MKTVCRHKHRIDIQSTVRQLRVRPQQTCDSVKISLQPQRVSEPSKKPANMAINKVILFGLTCFVCSQASPIRQLDPMTRPILVLPIFYVDEIRNVESAAVGTTSVEKESDEAFTTPAGEADLGSLDVEKRSAEQDSSSLEDLETAAGTNVLRPLFVYRQQVAYRQRIKDALRRENRF